MKIAQLLKKKPETDEQWETPPAYLPVPRDTKVKILRSCSGSSDGIRVQFFRENQIVAVSNELARLLIETGAAEII